MRNLACLIACLVAVTVSSSAGDCQTVVIQAPANRPMESLAALLKSRVPKDVPVLEDLSITKPDPSVPPQLAGLSGAWFGEWRGERTNAHMGDQVLVFEKVSPTSVTLFSGGIGRFPGSRGGSAGNAGQVWSTRYEDLRPSEVSPVTITNPKGNTSTYELRGEQLRVRTVSPRGSVWIGTFEKVAR